MKREGMTKLSCMICGGEYDLAREEGVVLCARCLEALGRAMQDKLGLVFPEEDAPNGAESGPWDKTLGRISDFSLE